MNGPAIYVGHKQPDRPAQFAKIEAELKGLGVGNAHLTRCNMFDGFVHFDPADNVCLQRLPTCSNWRSRPSKRQ